LKEKDKRIMELEREKDYYKKKQEFTTSRSTNGQEDVYKN